MPAKFYLPAVHLFDTGDEAGVFIFQNGFKLKITAKRSDEKHLYIWAEDPEHVSVEFEYDFDPEVDDLEVAGAKAAQVVFAAYTRFAFNEFKMYTLRGGYVL